MQNYSYWSSRVFESDAEAEPKRCRKKWTQPTGILQDFMVFLKQNTQQFKINIYSRFYISNLPLKNDFSSTSQIIFKLKWSQEERRHENKNLGASSRVENNVNVDTRISENRRKIGASVRKDQTIIEFIMETSINIQNGMIVIWLGIGFGSTSCFALQCLDRSADHHAVF